MSGQSLRRAALVAVALLAMFAATALATGNSVHVHAPSSATALKKYRVRLHGHATGTKLLYIFLDYQGCRRTPAGEHQRANGFIWQVTGDYSEVAVAHTPRSGTNHACAYLVKGSEPKNPSTGIVASDFVTFTVH